MEKILSLREVAINEPEEARIHDSLTCIFCGEGVMKTCARVVHGKISCIPWHWSGFCSPDPGS